MFCARASARLRPAPHTQYSLGGAGPNLTEVLGRVVNGRAQRGFVEGLVTRTNGVAPLLKITRDDINDEVKRRKKKKKKEAESARAAVLLSSGDAATDSVALVGSRVRFPLDTASSRLNARGDERRSASRASTNCAAPPLPRQRASLPFHQA
ncbi:hypothetical protein THAOC_09748 [Thalassiosira oceanica]|uniref:Uncharacterized protein n=1 Tax=Thalassiosira oceanica TaxID=159749 RepID=K0SUE3_THAOC|nr:hypothetical protein THAOC_09748 [Thalassiosira oceanica]|eukprot:EJK69035.1 hypothetical protein THAOC_09748 [Thalassiosira oceanica]